MEYEISRSSDWFGESKPCKNAYKSEVINRWVIKISSLEELNELIEEVGCAVVINQDWIEFTTLTGNNYD